jgi:hypothetical protein
MMTKTEYLKKLEEISHREFMSASLLVRELDITHNTYLKFKRTPEACSSKTMRKIKFFVDEWEAKNVSVSH